MLQGIAVSDAAGKIWGGKSGYSRAGGRAAAKQHTLFCCKQLRLRRIGTAAHRDAAAAGRRLKRKRGRRLRNTRALHIIK